MPGPYNPRDWDTEPWPLDAGLIPFNLRIPEKKVNPTVDEYFRKMMAKDGSEFDLPPPWPVSPQPGAVPYRPSTKKETAMGGM